MSVLYQFDDRSFGATSSVFAWQVSHTFKNIGARGAGDSAMHVFLIWLEVMSSNQNKSKIFAAVAEADYMLPTEELSPASGHVTDEFVENYITNIEILREAYLFQKTLTGNT